MKRKGFSLLLGVREYTEILNLQKRLNSARQKNTIPDSVMFLEHYHCITSGRQGKHEHILASQKVLKEEGIQVYDIDRGGDVTYHGPGQIICYPIIDLSNYENDVLAYARNLEEMVIRTLHTFGILAIRKCGHPGVWLDSNRKIAAMGITVNRNVTMHGVSLNVCPEMKHYSLIVPCGLSGYEVISMKECMGHMIDISTVIYEMQSHLSNIFNIELEEIGEEVISGLIEYAQDQAS